MPNPNFSKGIKDEHTAMWGCDEEFKTINYGLTTTPRKEYGISTAARLCPEEDMLDRSGGRVRVIRGLDELRPLKLSRDASLTDDEILAVVRALSSRPPPPPPPPPRETVGRDAFPLQPPQVLYSGPMFQLYNTILRRFPAEDFKRFDDGGNLFATTVAVLQSAVTKISRSMRLPPGLRLYRGLGGLAELPDTFDQADERGCRGYMEWGFLSTTSHWGAAVEYSGAGEGKPLPMVIQTCATSVDRGARIKELSQYPGEVSGAAARAERWWEPTGARCLGGDGARLRND